MKLTKKKLGAICLFMLIAIMSGIPVFAAETDSRNWTEYNLPDFETMAARATVTETRTGSSYNEVWLNMTCYCGFPSENQVQAVTAKDGATVMIESKSYNSKSITSLNGSDGNANVNSVSVTYTASSSVYYAAQVHSDNSNYNTAYATLFRY